MITRGISGTTVDARRNNTAGFTLLELMIAAVVVAVLAAIALPSYQLWIQNSRRADATTGLMDLANRMQRYYSENNTFVGATIAAGVPATDVLGSATSLQGYYTLTLCAPSDTAHACLTTTAYTLYATRVSPQTADTRCGDLTLTSTNVRGMVNATLTDPADCW